MRTFFTTLAFAHLALLLAANSSFAMDDSQDKQFEGSEEEYETSLLELIANFDCYSDVFNTLESKLSLETPDPREQGRGRKAVVLNSPLMTQWLDYFRLIAKSLDEFENGFVHWHSEPQPSKASLRFRNAKDLHKSVRKVLFDCDDDSELSNIEVNFVEKYEFFLFAKSVNNGTFINAIHQKARKKKDVPVLNLFTSLLKETNLDAVDFAFINLEKLYRRFALIQFDEQAELVTKIAKTYPKLRAIKKTKTANLKNAKKEQCQECSICLDDMLCLSHEDFCTNQDELIEPGFSCHDCLKEYLRQNIKKHSRSNFFDLHKICCPSKQCEKSFDSPNSWQYFLLSGVLERDDVLNILTWRFCTLSSSMPSSLLKCSSSNCSNLLSIDDQTTLECVQCLSTTCRLCKGKYARDCCNQIIIPPGSDMNQCPTCYTWAERSEGCDYIICVGCKSKFDITTGKLWTKEYASEEKSGSHSKGAMSQKDIDRIQRQLNKKTKKPRRKFEDTQK